ncbi:sigma-54 dependent transcriptional regulator [Desulfovibrio sp. OttesenSCG-928-A18]|nr:sigma-54 dependent transcriptional regulator [Desulfovibrio sp. OttesenSCG-928-A18]
MKSLLVIDDEPGHRLMVRAVLEDAGWQVFEASSGEEGVELFSANSQFANVVLVDMRMPGMDGQATLTRLHTINPSLPVILLTAYGTVGTAVEAMKRGAFDYLTKPADNDELILTLSRAWEYSRLQEENERLRTELSGDAALKPLVGASQPMRKVHDFIRQAGPSEATVLISGESGTGKELIVEALHACSGRAQKPLIKVNCAALPAQLLESELFGYERGAFTGAVKDKPGRFQLASGGTLFLDEIGEIPLDLQAKLLRAIQDRVVEPLGSVRSVPVDVRILAATNRNLRQAVADGIFREDLFFRLNVLEVVSPPLRERLEDLPLLVSHLIALLSDKNRKELRGVSPAFLQQLTLYPWPGNVRELENVLERSLILSRSDILDCDSLPPQILNSHNLAQQAGEQGTGAQAGSAGARPGTAGTSQAMRQPGAPGTSTQAPGTFPQAPETSPQAGEHWLQSLSAASAPPEAASPLEEAERNALLHALRANRGHREKTAEALGISRRTLQYKLKKFGLSRRG